MLAMLTGSGTNLKAGEYVFAPGKTPLEVIASLKRGEVLYRSVTIPEGTEMAKIVEILSVEGWVDYQIFWDLVHDPETAADFGNQGGNLEGYLFTDTY